MKHVCFILLFLSACTKFGKNVSIKGRVYDPVSGEGVANVEIWLQKGTKGLPGGNKTIKKAVTDADGYYHMDKLTLANTSVLAVNYGDRYPIGWWTGSTYSSYGAYPVQHGKQIHLDYHVAAYGNYQVAVNNVGCQGNDTIIVRQTNQVGSFLPIDWIVAGCSGQTTSMEKTPSGLVYTNYVVKRNGISSNHDTTFMIYANQDNIQMINY